MSSLYEHNGIEYTDSEVHGLHIRYFYQLVLYQVMIVIQVGLIISTIIKFRQTDKNRKLTEAEQRVKDRLKWLFVSVLSLGSLVFILVEWYGLADFLYDFAAFPNYCDIAAVLCNFTLLTYLLALYLFYLYRLHATFRNSAMHLSECHVRTLLALTFGIYLIMIILVFVFQKGAVKHTPFAWSMKPKDYKWIVICEGEFSIGIDPVLRWSLQIIVIICNTYYGVIFYKKLYDLLLFMQSQQHKNTDPKNAKTITSNSNLNAIVKLMNKQATLIMVSTASTSIFWSLANVLHYFGSFLQIFIYLDITINCFCLFLMFSWNNKLYNKICGPFAMLNRVCCSHFIESDTLLQMEADLTTKTKSDQEKEGSNKYELHFHSYNGTATATNGTSNATSNESK